MIFSHVDRRHGIHPKLFFGADRPIGRRTNKKTKKLGGGTKVGSQVVLHIILIYT